LAASALRPGRGDGVRKSSWALWPLFGVLAVLSLAGCPNGDDDPGGTGGSIGSSSPSQPLASSTPSPTSKDVAVRCPYNQYSEDFTPTTWIATVVDVCVTPDGQYVLVVNSSDFLLDIWPSASSALTESGNAEAKTFADLVNQQVATSTVPPPGHVLVPPGGWVVASGTPAASVFVTLSWDVLATTYAASKLASYVQSRLTNPSQAMAQRVAECAAEVKGAWSNVQDTSVSLDYLLADTALGPGFTCGSLINDVVNEAREPRLQVDALQSEFNRFRTTVKASVLDDLLNAVRNAANVLR
jgi:hypothetical protein